MKKLSLLACVSGIALIGLSLVLFSGCNKGGGQKASIVSAEKTSFNEVTAHLDPGGNFYLYLSTEQWLDNLSGKISGWKQLFAAIPDMSDEDRANVDKTFDLVTHLIKDSGVEDVSGVGMSSIATEKGVYHNKAIVHHYPDKGSGFLWTVFGGKAHVLTGLDLLPTNTAMATFSDLDIPLLWSAIQKEVGQSDLPQAQEFLNKLPENFENATGLKWNQVMSSLGGEFGFVITFDESKMIPIPLPTSEQLQIPEPGLMIVAKVKDDTIFDRVDAALKKGGKLPVASVDKSDLKMRTVAVPLPLPIQLRPTIATSKGYLFIASSDTLIQDALAVKGGQKPGLKSTEEFKRLAKDIPTEGNQFCYVSQRFGQTIMQIQRQALEMNAKLPAAQSKWLQSFMQPDKAVFAYNVRANSDEGWLTTGNGNQNPAVVLAAVPAAMVGVMAAVAIPNFVKARTTAQKNACINNLRQIDAAKQQWALENGKMGSAVPTEADLMPYLGHGHFPTCPEGGTYTINAVDQPPTCSISGHKLPQ